jgi:aryl-alcohol dehydrogenase-like predicted oxidoreductase
MSAPRWHNSGVINRPLGRTGVRVGALALGCMNFGGRTDPETSTEIIHRALDAGVTLVDTADVYGHDPADFTTGRGRSEEIVGRALRGRRDSVVLATKAHFPMSDDVNDQGNSRRHLTASVEASLRRLGSDRIDLFQLHHPSNAVPIDEPLRALDDLIRAGKVCYVGVSSFAAWQIVESLWVAKELGLHRVVSEQPAYNLLDRRAERELLPMARTYGLAVLPWSPTAGGFLTGGYRRGEAPPPGSRFAEFWDGETARRHLADPAYTVAETVATIAAAKGATPAQVAVAWCLRQPGITAPIVGPRTVEQLVDLVAAVDVELSPEDLAALDAVAPPGRATVPYYGYDGMAWVPWGPHEHRW